MPDNAKAAASRKLLASLEDLGAGTAFADQIFSLVGHSQFFAEFNRDDVDMLAGYMRILSPVFIRAFKDRILNIHPALLPAFKGLDAQHQAWEYGVKVSGATVHLVDEDLDAGPIVVQEAVPVLDTDTADDLSARILSVEHRIYPKAVRILLSRRHRVEGRRLIVEGEPIS